MFWIFLRFFKDICDWLVVKFGFCFEFLHFLDQIQLHVGEFKGFFVDPIDFIVVADENAVFFGENHCIYSVEHRNLDQNLLIFVPNLNKIIHPCCGYQNGFVIQNFCVYTYYFLVMIAGLFVVYVKKRIVFLKSSYF